MLLNWVILCYCFIWDIIMLTWEYFCLLLHAHVGECLDILIKEYNRMGIAVPTTNRQSTEVDEYEAPMLTGRQCSLVSTDTNSSATGKERIIRELKLYLSLVIPESKTSAFVFWARYSTELPILSKIAQSVLNTPKQ